MTSEGPEALPGDGGARVLVAVTYGLSVRYLLPTGVLNGLREFCHPVVGLGWDDPLLEHEFCAQGFEVIRLPDPRLDHDYRMLRRRLAIVHQRRLASPSSRIERKLRDAHEEMSTRVIGGAKRLRDRIILGLPGATAAAEAREPDELRKGTNVGEFSALLSTQAIDAVVSITPYHDQDGLVLWAAETAGIPTLTSVISFDNPTTRSRMVVRSDRILVWNQFNRDEILRSYPDVAPDRVAIIGAPQFDLHHRPELQMGDVEWRSAVGLPPDRPIILYGAGPSFLVPGEPRLVRLIDEAVDDGRIRADPFLLVRPHPADPPEVWQSLASTLRHGVVVAPWSVGSDPHRSWPTFDDLSIQMSSLAHSAVHINVCSSMTLDGAVFDRPQIGPNFIPDADSRASAQVADLYRREHWLPIARSGGLAVAEDPRSLVEAINAAVADPEAAAAGRARMLREILSFLDGASSGRLLDEIRRFLDAR